MTIAPKVNNTVAKYLTLRNLLLIFLAIRVNPPTASKYVTNPDIKGAATLIHGYVARLGLGITLIKNQIVDIIPKRKKTSFGGM